MITRILGVYQPIEQGWRRCVLKSRQASQFSVFFRGTISGPHVIVGERSFEFLFSRNKYISVILKQSGRILGGLAEVII